MSIDIEDQNTCLPNKKSGILGRLPCAKFAIAASVSLASFTLGATMLIILPETHSLIPFYSGLITGSISYWCNPPSYDGKK